MSINFLLGKGIGFVRTASITKPINPKNLRYAPELADSVNLTMKKLSKEDLNRWDNAVRNICRNNLEGLPSTSNMNYPDRGELRQVLHSTHDIEPFLLMSTGGRSAISTNMHPILNELKSSKYSVLSDAINNFSNAFIFNKDAMLENINKNKEFYIKRLNLPPETSNQKVYQILTCQESPINTLKRKDCQDIIGIMFGYPKKDTIIFQLERDTGLGPELRKDIPRFKTELKKVLNSDDSKYKSFGKDFKQEIENSIDSIESINISRDVGYPEGYTFINYTNDSVEAARIGAQVRESTKELDRLNKIAEERQFSEDLDSFEQMRFQTPDVFLRDLLDKYGK